MQSIYPSMRDDQHQKRTTKQASAKDKMSLYSIEQIRYKGKCTGRPRRRLQQQARLLLLLLGEEDTLDGLVEHGLEVLAGLCGALKVLDGLDLLGECLTALRGDYVLA